MDEFITLKIKLGKNEWFALRDNAQQDYREPAAQARYLLRNVLLSECLEKVNSARGIRQDNPSTVAKVNP